MQSENILRSSLNDLLFENRNKLYGAYVLRRDYPKQLLRALVAMLSLCAIFALFSAGASEFRPPAQLLFADGHVLREVRASVPVKTPPAAQRRAVATAKFVSRIRISPEPASTAPISSLGHLAIGGVDQLADSTATGQGLVLSGLGAAPAPAAARVPDPEEPVSDPDVQPAFPGGQAALLAFLQRHLQSPVPLEPGESVQVQISFVVGYDGVLQSFGIQQDGGRLFNEEVIRVLKSMPRWIPGRMGSRAVAAWFSLPVKFTGDE